MKESRTVKINKENAESKGIVKNSKKINKTVQNPRDVKVWKKRTMRKLTNTKSNIL